MKQHVVSGILCLAMAGCAQSRLAVTNEKEDSKPKPVGLAPVPSVYDTVNVGMGGKAVSKTAMANPDDPHWSGQAQVALVKKPTAAGSAAPADGANGTSPANSGSPAAPGAALAQNPPAQQPIYNPMPGAASVPSNTAVPATSAAPAADWPPPARLSSAAAAQPASMPSMLPGPVANSPATGASSAQPGLAAEPPIAAVSNLPPVGDLTPAAARMPDGAGQSAQSAADRGHSPGASVAGVAAPPATMMPLEASSAKPPSPKRERDPLLGPDPDIMPQMNELPPLESSANGKAAASMTSPPPSSAIGLRTVNTARPPLPEPGSQPPSAITEPAATAGSKPNAPGPPPLATAGSDPAAPGPPPAVSPDGKPAASANTLPAPPDLGPSGPSASAPTPGKAASNAGNSAPQPAPGLPAAPGNSSLESAPPVQAAPDAPTQPPASNPAPAQTPALPELPPLPGDPDKTTATSKPATAGSLALNIPLEAAPAPSGAALMSVDRLMAGAAPGLPPRDGQVVLASATASESKPNQKAAGHPIARVGDEIITQHDLSTAYREALSHHPELRQESDFDTEEKLAKRTMRAMLARQTLADLIVRSMLAQEAKRLIQKHDPKEYDRFLGLADKVWREEELAPMKRRLKVESDQQLREKLAEHGQSLETMKQSFIHTALAEQFLHEKLKDKVNVELPDLLRYYNEHIPLHEFDRPALITWREFVVEAGKYQSRDQARRKAEEALRLLQNGQDFASLAKAESDGPSSSRSQGGLMQTSPGGYAIASVNAALETLEVGRVSGLLEGDDSFHIVKVENRRPAGPASFEEVQDRIRPIIARKKEQDERVAFLSKLRKKTIIWTAYDGTPEDPQALLP